MVCSSLVLEEVELAMGKRELRPAFGRGYSQKALSGGDLWEARQLIFLDQKVTSWSLI